MGTTGIEVVLIEGIDLEHVPPCEMRQYNHFTGEVTWVCGQPSVARLRFRFSCGRVVTRWVCQMSLDISRTTRDYWCVACREWESFSWTSL